MTFPCLTRKLFYHTRKNLRGTNTLAYSVLVVPVIKNIRLDRGKFAREKHSSLFCISASDEKTLD